MTTTLAIEEIVDLSRYPIADAAARGHKQFVEKCRQEYVQNGLCALPGFLLPRTQKILAEEANTASEHAYFCRDTHNAYLTVDDPSLPQDDVARRQEQTYVGSVAYDLIGKETHLNKLYMWDPLKNFIGAVLDKPEFYRFADPFGACSINVFVEGGRHGWHFDESEYTITLMLQSPESGGAFEYVPGLRERANERECVQRVLDGDRTGVMELPFTAGTLLIFAGRQTIHRVTRVTGNKPRLVPVLCYSERPNMKNSEAVRKLFWGRAGV